MFVAIKVLILYTVGLSFLTQRLQRALGGGEEPPVATETRTYITTITTDKNVTYTNTTRVVVPLLNHTRASHGRISLMTVTQLIATEVGGTLALMLRAPVRPQTDKRSAAGSTKTQ